MVNEANPFADADRIARRRVAERAAFYAEVVQVVGAQVEVIRVGESQSLGLCDASDYVVANAIAGDTVVCLHVGSRVFVLAIKAEEGS